VSVARATELAEELRGTRPANVDPEYKRELVEIANKLGVTLDGRRARVAGVARDFARVQITETSGPHYEVEWAWGSVAHVIAHTGGRFKS
jgi:hypothetical protein